MEFVFIDHFWEDMSSIIELWINMHFWNSTADKLALIIWLLEVGNEPNFEEYGETSHLQRYID